jgi:prepilin-type N-terminal cleavage/methylation domain-containing protein
MRARHGFTVIELLLVLMLAGVTLGMTAPGVSRAVTETRVHRAAAVVAAEANVAQGLAARARVPVRLTVSADGRLVRVHRGTPGVPDTVYAERRFDGTSEYALGSIAANQTETVFYPNGLTSGQLVVTLRAGTSRRTVTVTRGGHVRVE